MTISPTVDQYVGSLHLCIPGYIGGKTEEAEHARIGFWHDEFGQFGLSTGIAVAAKALATFEGSFKFFIREEIDPATLRR